MKTINITNKNATGFFKKARKKLENNEVSFQFIKIGKIVIVPECIRKHLKNQK